MTAIYETKGTLTDAIPTEEDVRAAQNYLTEDDMTQYLDSPLDDAIVRVKWDLDSDGYNWRVEAIANRELSDTELKQLSEWVSGQNSDGLGEGFEQQEFAWIPSDESCDCDGGGTWCTCAEDEGHMCSFDWETNECSFTRLV